MHQSGHDQQAQILWFLVPEARGARYDEQDGTLEGEEDDEQPRVLVGPHSGAADECEGRNDGERDDDLCQDQAVDLNDEFVSDFRAGEAHLVVSQRVLLLIPDLGSMASDLF